MQSARYCKKGFCSVNGLSFSLIELHEGHEIRLFQLRFRYNTKKVGNGILIGGGCSCCAGEAPVILEVVVELLDGAHLAHGLSVLKRVAQSVLQTNKFKSIKIFLICSSRLRPLPTKEIELVGAADGSR
ncbi:hypothetical protein AB4K20DRAFT_1872092 [Rhizopus microsporus]